MFAIPVNKSLLLAPIDSLTAVIVVRNWTTLVGKLPISKVSWTSFVCTIVNNTVALSDPSLLSKSSVITKPLTSVNLTNIFLLAPVVFWVICITALALPSLPIVISFCAAVKPLPSSLSILRSVPEAELALAFKFTLAPTEPYIIISLSSTSFVISTVDISAPHIEFVDKSTDLAGLANIFIFSLVKSLFTIEPTTLNL